MENIAMHHAITGKVQSTLLDMRRPRPEPLGRQNARQAATAWLLRIHGVCRRTCNALVREVGYPAATSPRTTEGGTDDEAHRNRRRSRRDRSVRCTESCDRLRRPASAILC